MDSNDKRIKVSMIEILVVVGLFSMIAIGLFFWGFYSGHQYNIEQRNFLDNELTKCRNESLQFGDPFGTVEIKHTNDITGEVETFPLKVSVNNS